MPRPKLKPDEEQRALVKQLAAVGISQHQIARKIKIRSPKTLRKYFRDELDFGAMEADANVIGALYNSATSGNVAAQRTWLLFRASRNRTATETKPAQVPEFIVALDKTDAPGKAEDDKEVA